MKRLDYWRSKLPAARAEERIREKELNQMARAFQRAVEQVSEIEQRIANEKTKLARTE
jgi:flagellar motor switch protein FliM